MLGVDVEVDVHVEEAAVATLMESATEERRVDEQIEPVNSAEETLEIRRGDHVEIPLRRRTTFVEA